LGIGNPSTRGEIDTAFATLVEQRIGALLVGGIPCLTTIQIAA
jgi:hypothetical protein